MNLSDYQNAISQRVIDQYYYSGMNNIAAMGFNPSTLTPPKSPAKESWQDKYKVVADYDYNSDTLVMKATGERVIRSQIEDGYEPPRTNSEWLDRQINNVRNYAYSR